MKKLHALTVTNMATGRNVEVTSWWI